MAERSSTVCEICLHNNPARVELLSFKCFKQMDHRSSRRVPVVFSSQERRLVEVQAGSNVIRPLPQIKLEPNKRFILCLNFDRGTCYRGDSCTFAHSREEQESWNVQLGTERDDGAKIGSYIKQQFSMPSQPEFKLQDSQFPSLSPRSPVTPPTQNTASSGWTEVVGRHKRQTAVNRAQMPHQHFPPLQRQPVSAYHRSSSEGHARPPIQRHQSAHSAYNHPVAHEQSRSLSESSADLGHVHPQMHRTQGFQHQVPASMQGYTQQGNSQGYSQPSRQIPVPGIPYNQGPPQMQPIQPMPNVPHYSIGPSHPYGAVPMPSHQLPPTVHGPPPHSHYPAGNMGPHNQAMPAHPSMQPQMNMPRYRAPHVPPASVQQAPADEWPSMSPPATPTVPTVHLPHPSNVAFGAQKGPLMHQPHSHTSQLPHSNTVQQPRSNTAQLPHTAQAQTTQRPQAALSVSNGNEVAPKDLVHSQLSRANYKPKFKELLVLEEAEHKRVLEDKCNGQYTLVLYQAGAKPPNHYRFNEGARYRRYGYLDGISGDQVAYATQASQGAINIHNLRGVNICKADILRDNYNHTEERLYIAFSVNDDSKMQNEFPEARIQGFIVAVRFILKHSYFRNLKSCVDRVLPAIVEKIVPNSRIFRVASPLQISIDLGKYRSLCSADQLEALKAILTVPPQGPPNAIVGPFGTGKTRILAIAANCFFAEARLKQQPARILVCTQQRESVDNFYEHYQNLMGNEKTDLEVIILRDYGFKHQKTEEKNVYKTLEEFRYYRRVLNTQQSHLIMSTCMMVRELVKDVGTQFFTHILIDEGAQMREPEAIAPLSLAHPETTKIVIAGDQHQVGPAMLVFGEVPLSCGLALSLLERLYIAYKKYRQEAYISTLVTNYRSHPDIVELPSALFYETPLIAPHDRDPPPLHPKYPYPLVFICSSLDEAVCQVDGNINREEASILLDEISKFARSWPSPSWGPVDLSQTCIMSPTRPQLTTANQLISEMKLSSRLKAMRRLPTYDMQGREFRALFLSTSEPTNANASTRNPTKSLCDRHIFNTAITRAQSLVVASGNPFLLLKTEQTMIEKYGKKGKVWSNYMKRCLEHNSFVIPDSLRVKGSGKKALMTKIIGLVSERVKGDQNEVTVEEIEPSEEDFPPLVSPKAAVNRNPVAPSPRSPLTSSHTINSPQQAPESLHSYMHHPSTATPVAQILQVQPAVPQHTAQMPSATQPPLASSFYVQPQPTASLNGAPQIPQPTTAPMPRHTGGLSQTPNYAAQPEASFQMSQPVMSSFPQMPPSTTQMPAAQNPQPPASSLQMPTAHASQPIPVAPMANSFQNASIEDLFPALRVATAQVNGHTQPSYLQPSPLDGRNYPGLSQLNGNASVQGQQPSMQSGVATNSTPVPTQNLGQTPDLTSLSHQVAALQLSSQEPQQSVHTIHPPPAVSPHAQQNSATQHATESRRNHHRSQLESIDSPLIDDVFSPIEHPTGKVAGLTRPSTGSIPQTSSSSVWTGGEMRVSPEPDDSHIISRPQKESHTNVTSELVPGHRRSPPISDDTHRRTPSPQHKRGAAAAATPTPPVSRLEKDYEVKDQIGRGGFGVVFHVRSKVDEGEYALKVIRLTNVPREQDKVMREVRALAQLHHGHIVRYHTSWKEKAPEGWGEKKLWSMLKSSGSLPSSIYPVLTAVGSTHTTPTTSSSSPYTTHTAALSPVGGALDLSGAAYNPQFSIDSVVTFHDDSQPADLLQAAASQGPKQLLTLDSHSDVLRVGPPPRLPVLTPPPTCLFIQTELCQRDTLQTWLRKHCDEKSRTKKDVLCYFKQIVDALVYIHSHQFVHRDLKPSNIFFSRQEAGKLKIGDFGLVTTGVAVPHGGGDAVRLGSMDSHSRGSVQAGTYLYMSPEQKDGIKCDEKSDMYALGVIFFELHYCMKTDAQRFAVLSALRSKLDFPPNFKERLPNEVTNIVRQLLAEGPDHRPTALQLQRNNSLQTLEKKVKKSKREYIQVF